MGGRGRGLEFAWMDGIGRMRMLVRRSGLDLGGATHVTATVRSMGEGERSWTGRFRIDRGVVDCVVPKRSSRAI